MLGISSEIPSISKTWNFDYKAGAELTIEIGGGLGFFHMFRLELRDETQDLQNTIHYLIYWVNSIFNWPLIFSYVQMAIHKYGYLAMKTNFLRYVDVERLFQTKRFRMFATSPPLT